MMAWPKLARATSGMVFVEFVLVVVPVLLTLLCIAQALLLQGGRLATVAASHSAVRAAVVILDDDPDRYGGQPRNEIGAGTQRWNEVRRAAAGTLVAVLPPNRPWSAESGFDIAIRSPGIETALPGLLEPDASLLNNIELRFDSASYGRDDQVTVEVRFRFPCHVPLGRRLLCDQTDGGTRFRMLTAESSLTNQGAGYDYP